MVELGIKLASLDPTYEDDVLQFVEHFVWIAKSINAFEAEGMWNEQDGFYYDTLQLPHGGKKRLKIRSIFGLLPLCAVSVIEPWQREMAPLATKKAHKLKYEQPELMQFIHATGPKDYGYAERGILALVNQERLRRMLTCVLDENEFLSPYGIRTLSKAHLEHPCIVEVNKKIFSISYCPAESTSVIYGDNFNWQGAIWMPMNIIFLRALQQYYLYYGDSFLVECPTGSGKMMNLFEISQEISTRLRSLFLPDAQGKRPIYGHRNKQQTDPYWKDYILFYESFNGDNGMGIGASHQTGWTGLIAKIIQVYSELDAKIFLEKGKHYLFHRPMY